MGSVPFSSRNYCMVLQVEMIRCLLEPRMDADATYLVSKMAFFEHFDQADFACRDVMDVSLRYSAKWLYNQESGQVIFEPGTVQFIQGQTQFISGRHRTAVLLHYLDVLPFAFSKINFPPHEFFTRINGIKIHRGYEFEIPRLPTVKFEEEA
jgi:hypothetical protein